MCQSLFYLVQGYMPEWILLEKQVRESIEQARLDLKRVMKKIASKQPSTDDEQKTYLFDDVKWTEAIGKFRAEIAEINVNISKLNLVVPMLWRQQVFDSFLHRKKAHLVVSVLIDSLQC
jgi:DnaJ homolog subfamily C member 28